jgi:hypothetical protein
LGLKGRKNPLAKNFLRFVFRRNQPQLFAVKNKGKFDVSIRQGSGVNRRFRYGTQHLPLHFFYAFAVPTPLNRSRGAIFAVLKDYKRRRVKSLRKNT